MRERFEKALTFQQFLDTIEGSEHPWQAFYQRARLPAGVEEKGRALEGHWHFLVLCEEWCGDGANALPYLARLTEAVPNFHLRVLGRDDNPDLMDAHLTNGNRAIPIVMILDEDFREVAWWGPRPEPLQEYFLRELKSLPKAHRYPKLRAWYARDRGRTTLREILHRIPVLAER